MDFVERRDSPTGGQPVDIKGRLSMVLEQRGGAAALQLVAALQRKWLPTLPQLYTPDPANSTKRIEEGGAIVIGQRFTESLRGRRQKVTLIALFLKREPFVELRSYQELISEQVLDRRLLIPRGPLIEGHQAIFEKADRPEQQRLIGLVVDKISPQRVGGAPELKP